MLPIHKILVPINFTEACRSSARFAIDLASAWDASVWIVHVLEPVGSAIGFESAIMLEDSLRSQRQRASGELDGFLGIPSSEKLQRILMEGDPATEIVRLAHNERFNLILLPTRGYGIFRRLLLGSVTAKVLHDADCPVWTGVHPEAVTGDGVISIHRVACAVDLGPQTRTALNWAAEFARESKAALSVVHILPLVPDLVWRDQLADIAREQIRTSLSDVGVEADVHLSFGNIPAALTEVVRQLRSDLVVIGRGHLTAGARLNGGAYAIIRDSACPVVSV
jgi:nucleotide-binding universal stress UspA family protein